MATKKTKSKTKKTFPKKKPTAKKAKPVKKVTHMAKKTVKKPEVVFDERHINIIIPMAGGGAAFKNAGYAFPKPIIDIKGKTMIEVVIDNLKPKNTSHTFIFICHREHYEKFDLHHIFQKATDNKFEVVLLSSKTEGAACTVLTAARFINNEDDLLIANSDQFVEFNIDEYIKKARTNTEGGMLMTFNSSHPRWSYARANASGKVLEVAEKKVISNHATAGIYYFAHGKDFVRAGQSMIHKGIRYNNEFYVSPVYNELILEKKDVVIDEIDTKKMHGLGTPEDLNIFLQKLDKNEVKL